jgi:predicted ATPase
VGEAVLKTCISEIRKALGDHPMRPQFIETVHRRGYRFLVSVSPLMVQPGSPALSHPAASPRPFVGRKVEIAFLDNFWQQCRQGRRQVIFVTGEPGIGKTLLVNVFENTLSADGDVWIGRGQCVEQHGPGEPYLPILEALGRLCREPRGERLVTLLKRLAPTWLAQLPGVIEPAEAEALRPSLAGVTPVRVMRELADAIEAFTAESLLLLVLEDLHALDHSTLEWLAYVARRSGPARLMIIGTYRPADLILRDHPLKAVKHELLVNGHCQELPLDCLNVTEVRDYLGLRLADLPPADQALSSLARVVYSRTEGNPLFMVNIVDYLLTQQLLVRADKTLRLADPSAVRTIPTGLRQFINMRVEQLADADRKVLAAASVAGLDFSTATVAAALKAPLEDVDRSCHELARALQFIASAGTDEWPDGTQSAPRCTGA